MKIIVPLLLLVVLTFATCIKPPDYPIEPQIEFTGLSKTTMRQGQLGSEDSLYLFFSFTDGDGDIGGVGQDKDSLNIFLTDKRNNQLAERFRIPFVPEQGAGNGISGEVQVLLFTTCCNVLPPCEPSLTKPIDTLVYEIYIKDRAGNKSNVIQTSPIFLQCK
jgi:hypothetical protein